MADNKDFDRPISGHDYDGIQEFDNPLPGWWLVTFLGTVIFGFIYWIHYDVSKAGPSLDQELSSDLAAIQAKQQASVLAGGNATTDFNALMADVSVMTKGKEVYTGRCAACHGAEGGGQIGPNLTDNYWIHGDGSPAQIHKVIAEGVTAKGMPPWEAQLSPADLNAVTAFVASIKGTNVAGGKAAEGTEYK